MIEEPPHRRFRVEHGELVARARMAIGGDNLR